VYRSDRVKERQSKLSSEKRELLEKRLRGKSVSSDSSGKIPIRSQEEPVPLSFAQQRLWFLDQLEEETTAYYIPIAVRLKGSLCIEVLQQCFDEIMRRHEALRTTFIVEDEEPRQIVHQNVKTVISGKNLQHIREEEKLSVIHKIANEEFQRPFDLTKGPLIRFTLLQSDVEDHVLLITMHHIISDAWSIGIFFRELTTLYQAFTEERTSLLPELRIQYPDFSSWQRREMNGSFFEKNIRYWKDRLVGAPELLHLPTDRPRPPVQTNRGCVEFFTCTPVLAGKLKTLSHKTDGSLFITLLTVFIVLLHKYSGENDILVGTPSANRNRREIEPLIGFFVNTLVIRTGITGNPVFLKLLEMVRQISLDSFEHQDLPFEYLIEALRLKRNLSHNPLFQVMFVLQNAPVGDLKIPGMKTTPLELDYVTSLFDLTLSMEENRNGLMGFIEYNTDLFDRCTIEKMIGHFKALLTVIAENPDQKISELPLLNEAERYQMLVEWNDTKSAYSEERCVLQLFEEQAVRTPESLAVICEEESLTYRGLNSRANQLAHHLRRHGVGPEVLVGICTERSPEMIIGLLAILKSGGAYVPLDPVYPEERLAFMAVDSGMQILLTTKQLPPSMNNIASQNLTSKIIFIDSDEIERESKNDPVAGITPENLAYVIYTSGSTGKPKGTMIQHKSLLNFVESAIDEYGIQKSDRVLQFASICFDASVEEIFPSLLSGGCLILRTDEMLDSVTGFLEKCEEMKITVLDLPTAYWHEVVAEFSRLKLTLPETLRLLIIGGERANPEDVGVWNRLIGDMPILVNTYGPTEATIVTTKFNLSGLIDIASEGREVPIGSPIQNAQTYILDKYLQPVPAGIPGELHIGGAGLARGYLNRNDLTAEKFIPDHFSQTPGARLYRTGDLARYLPDGTIEFLGRLDRQVKLRGFRIEPEEIESAIINLPEIKECVVIAREDESNHKQLVAYVTSDGEKIVSEELRNYVKTKLPDYMIPSFFVEIEKFPVTPGGKIDYRALPEPKIEYREEDFASARTPAEDVLCAIWMEILKISQIGIHDNFFELGGHSLLATQVISRIREAFTVELSVRSLFESPTIAELGKTIEVTLHQKVSGTPPSINPASEDRKHELSFAQQRLWFLDQIDGQNSNYNLAGATRLAGNTDIRILERVLNEIVRRHDILRTTFTNVDGKPCQVISPEQSLTLKVEDVREEEIIHVCNEKALKPFDLSKGPLFRMHFFQTKSEEYILFVVMHHIVSDGWSIEVLFKEITTLCTAFSQGKSSPLDELSLQYSDFAVWQREWLKGEVLEKQLNYWKGQLQEIPSLLELPTDRPRPPVQTYKGSTEIFEVDQVLTERLKSLSLQSRVSLFMALHATFSLLLSRYSRQDDIVVGVPIANRNHKQIEPLIGFFVNTLVLRTNLFGGQHFNELLERIRTVTLEAYAHQDIPFELLVEELHPERDMSYSPLFQVMFAFQNTSFIHGDDPGLSGLIEGSIELKNTKSKFDFSLFMEETDQGIVGAFEYNTDLFDKSTIQRLIAHFKALLAAVSDNPEKRIQEYSLLTKTERHQILVEWNETESNYPRGKCIHQLFEEQVERKPDAVAVVFEEQNITYRQLNIKANKLANYLKNLGVGPEVLVGVCLERSVEMVIALLGILKSGGAYVPLDSDYPEERLSFMVEDSGIRILLTSQKLSSCVANLKPANGTLHSICLDSEWASLIDMSSEENLVCEATPENLVYVMYTSGSTGRPKGTRIMHDGVIRLVRETNYVDITWEDTFLLLAPFSFDISTFEIWGTLLNGARMVIMPPGIPSLDELGKTVKIYNITTLILTTGLFHMMVNERIEDLKGVRYLLAGGDVLSSHHANIALTELQETKIINGYGPVENATLTSFYRLTEPIEGSVPIGKPLSNTEVYILDKELQPVPVGVAGELYTGGVGLARDYLNRPDITAERFIPNLFSREPGGRLYRTGDLVRYLPDGNIEFLGRIDNQVKIRGFRVEPGEIETVLGQHPRVRQNAVIVHETSKTEKYLVAYVVIQEKHEVKKPELRSFLEERLPDYMIPSAFVVLDSLPLTPNGKVDRRSLQEANYEHPISEERFVAPRTPEEEMLVGVWAGVLDTEKIGIHDNFFELGGHSLLATQIISRIRDAFNRELPLRKLFETPTIEGLGKYLTSLRRESVLPPITPIDRTKPLPISFSQQRLWFLDQLEGPSATYNISAALHIEGQLQRSNMEQSLQNLVRRHECLRTMFPKIDGKPILQISGDTFQLSVVDLTKLSTEEQKLKVGLLANDEAVRPFVLETGPLFRATLLQLEDGSHVLLLNMHHIISDGWSIGILVREWSLLYDALVQDTLSALPPQPVQYIDFAGWQRQWLQGEVLEVQLNYWKQQLNDAPAILELPTDYPRPPMQSYRGASSPVSLTSELTTQLKNLSRQSGSTLFMTLLSAFAVLLSRYSRQSDIVIGSPIANRTNSQTESLIGFFVNTLVLRLDVTGILSFEELLQQVRRVALGAYSHQDIPFEQLVEELNPERSLSYSPLFQVMFVLQNAPMSDLELHGLKVTPIETESVISQFDLTLSLVETAHGLTGELEYNTDLFEPITIERMIEHLPVLLSGLVEDPQQCIGELSLLTRAEEHQIQSWNFAAPNVPNDKNIIILFEEQVNKTPDNIAVVFNEQQLTYHELNVKANKLAHYIQSIGVKPEMLVGICLERSPEVVIGMLSILKSGGTYVPVDPTYPDTRIRSMLAESGVEVLLTHSGLTARFKEMNIAKTKVVCLDVEVDDVSQLSAENLTGRVGLDNLAYVIYTSGSTGQPKGVMVEHHTLSGHCREIRSYYQLNSGYRVLQFASFNFDVSLEQVFSALISGASLIIRDDTVWTITDFCQKIIDNKITVVDIPPAYCQQWLRELNRLPEFARNNELKLVIVGGEIMSPEILSLWQQTPLNSIRLINAYGPTETTITTTSFEITDHFEEKKDVHRIPIGRPLANRTAYILDAFKKPVPIGVPGELHVGGSGLARGYLNNPDLTRERFINNPFSEEANSRLYKTGDLACWLPDGNIEFLGRVDDQVKIRGFRIEPGEIEVVLERNPYIRESAVIVNETAKEEKHLVAYVVMLEGYDLQNTELRQFLKERLPDYMIPSFFVEMDLLPVTPGGKVDRKALPAPDKNGNNIRKGYLAPRTILEMQITKIWEDIMEQHPIGVRDNFFELGGHSLMAVRLVTQIEEKKGRTLSLQALFQTPTIEGLATLLNQNTMHEPWSHLVPIQPLGSKSPLFCIHPDGGNVLCYMELAQNLGYDIPLYGLQALGTDDGDEPLMRVEEMAETYLRAIRTVRPGGPYNLAGWSFGGVVAFEMARQLKNQSEEVSLLALIDSSAPGIHENQMEWDDAELLVFLMGEVMSLSVDHLRQLGPDEQLLYVIKEAEKKALFSPDFGLDQARRFLRVIKANNKAYYDFSMKPYCGKIHFFRASEKLPEKYSLPEGDKDHVSIWAKFATGGIEVHEVTGNHRNMMVRPHVQVLADIVKKVMDASIQY